MRSEFLPYGKQSINQNDIEAVIEVLRSSFLTTGPRVLDFENALAQRVGVKHGIAIANGTASLHARRRNLAPAGRCQ